MAADVGATLLGLELLESRLQTASRIIVEKGAEMLRSSSQLMAPVGVMGNSTNPPGDLGRSIVVKGPVPTGVGYSAMVGPTVIYARQRALGGYITPKGDNLSGLLSFQIFGQQIMTTIVKQVAHPYMHPGRDLAVPKIAAMARVEAGLAVRGK